MATLNIENKIVAFGDVALTNNPRLRYVDWYRSIQGITLNNPRTESFRLVPGQSVNVAGMSLTSATPLTIDTIDTSSGLRAKLGGNFGTVHALIEELVSITVKPSGLVDFEVPDSATLDLVQPNDIFWVKGYCTLDGSGNPINQINEGLWKVVRKNGVVLTCQKMGGTGAISQGSFTSPIGELGDYALVVSSNLKANLGEYLSFNLSELSLFNILYADAERIDIDLPSFDVPPGTEAVVSDYKCSFVYIESTGKSLVHYEIGTAEFDAPVVPFGASAEGKVGWCQLTSELNFLRVTNQDANAIDVTVIVGG